MISETAFSPRLFGLALGAALALGIGAALTLGIGAAQARPVAPATVALTYDDLPGLVLKPDQAYVDKTNTALIAALKRHRFPTIGFVNEGKIDDLVRDRQITVLHQWIDAGFDLGNHTFSHESPNTLGAQGYVEDIANGEHVIRPMMDAAHRPLKWFRHPYLETGSTLATKTAIDDWLAAHGYTIAPVTIDCDDWEFAEPYDAAVMAGNRAAAKRIRDSYLAYTERTITWYRSASRIIFGRDIAYVMLLHDTRLNADTFAAFAAILRRQRMTPITLDQAMRDPAYRTPDTYVGKDGIEWMERFSRTLKKDIPWDSFQDVPKAIKDEYNRVDN